MARRVRRTRSRAGDQELVWCAMMSNQNTVAAGAAEEQLIVTGPDWFGGAGGGEATLMRIRGSFSIIPVVGGINASVVQLAVYKTRTTSGAFAVPWTVDSLVDQDVLLFEQFSVTRSTTDYIGVTLNYFSIDVKAKRRIDSADDIRLMVSLTGSGTALYTVATRALVKV